MKYFYQTLLLMTRFELAIARSTGRNPANIRQLRQEEMRWLRLLQDMEVQNG